MAGAKLSARPQIATIDVADFLYIVDASETAGLGQSKHVTISQLDSRFGSAAPVDSVFGRTGAVAAQAGDYTAADVSALAIANDLSDLNSASTARTNLNVDVAGTDNSTDVTLAGTPDYLTITGQQITRNAIDLTTDITGALPIANGGTGEATAQAATNALTQVSAATDEHVLTKDTGTGNATWKAAAGGGLTVDTQTNILGTTPPGAEFYFASDGEHLWLYDGSDWRVTPLRLQERNSIDMGAYAGPGTLGEQSNVSGYYDDMLTDKTLLNVLLGGNARTENGGLRIDTTQEPDSFEIYLGNQWQNIIYDLTTVNSELEHTPLSKTIDVWSGNSNSVGLNGLPIIQEYKVSMGAYPAPVMIDGGSF